MILGHPILRKTSPYADLTLSNWTVASGLDAASDPDGDGFFSLSGNIPINAYYNDFLSGDFTLEIIYSTWVSVGLPIYIYESDDQGDRLKTISCYIYSYTANGINIRYKPTYGNNLYTGVTGSDVWKFQREGSSLKSYRNDSLLNTITVSEQYITMRLSTLFAGSVSQVAARLTQG